MTVSSETSSVSYAGDGVTKTFAVPYLFYAASDISPVLVSGAGESAAGAFSTAGEGTPTGGSVTFVTAPPIGRTVRIDRDPPRTQLNAYTDRGRFPASSHERALDRNVMMIQATDMKRARLEDRALRLPVGKSAPIVIPEEIENRFLFGKAGGGVGGALGSDLTPLIAQGAIDVVDSRTQISDQPTRAAAMAATMPVVRQFTRIAGYTASGDFGEATYKRVSAQPSHSAKFRSAEGAWWEFAEPSLRPEQLGVFGNGTDVAAGLLLVCIAANALGIPVNLTDGKTYTISKLVIPGGTRFIGEGVIRSNGALTNLDDIPLVTGANCRFRNLNFTTPATGTNRRLISIGDGNVIGALDTRADAPRDMAGVSCTGQDVKIGFHRSINIARPLTVDGVDGDPAIGGGAPLKMSTGFTLGGAEYIGIIRGFRMTYQREPNVGDLYIYGRSPFAGVLENGQNCVLISCIDGGRIGNCYLGNSPEHAFRIGGVSDTYNYPYQQTKDLKIGVISAVSPLGCALKINPGSYFVSSGVYDTVDNLTVEAVVGIDVGEGNLGGNREIVRASHYRNLTIGQVTGRASKTTRSCQTALLLMDGIGLQIGQLDVTDINSAVISVLGQSTGTGDSPGAGPTSVRGLRIAEMRATIAGNPLYAISVVLEGANNIGSWLINGEIQGYVSQVYFMNYTGATPSGPLRFVLSTPTELGSRVNGLENYAGVQVDMRSGASRSISVGPYNGGLDNGNTQLFLDAQGSTTAGAGQSGAGIEWGGAGTARRRWNVRAYQTGAGGEATSLMHSGPSNSGSSSALVDRFQEWHTGDFENLTAGAGFITKTPDGTKRYRIFVNNAGTLSVTQL